jgi:hypothetical protein
LGLAYYTRHPACTRISMPVHNLHIYLSAHVCVAVQYDGCTEHSCGVSSALAPDTTNDSHCAQCHRQSTYRFTVGGAAWSVAQCTQRSPMHDNVVVDHRHISTLQSAIGTVPNYRTGRGRRYCKSYLLTPTPVPGPCTGSSVALRAIGHVHHTRVRQLGHKHLHLLCGHTISS